MHQKVFRLAQNSIMLLLLKLVRSTRFKLFCNSVADQGFPGHGMGAQP